MMKIEILGYVGNNIVCNCKEHQPDTFLVIPVGDLVSNPVGVIVDIDEHSFNTGDCISVASIDTAVDIARGEEFCLKVHNATISDMIERDRMETFGGPMEQRVDKCEQCLHNAGYDYDTGRVICNRRGVCE